MGPPEYGRRRLQPHSPSLKGASCSQDGDARTVTTTLSHKPSCGDVALLLSQHLDSTLHTMAAHSSPFSLSAKPSLCHHHRPADCYRPSATISSQHCSCHRVSSPSHLLCTSGTCHRPPSSPRSIQTPSQDQPDTPSSLSPANSAPRRSDMVTTSLGHHSMDSVASETQRPPPSPPEPLSLLPGKQM